MAEEKRQFWVANKEDLRDMTPRKARDLIIRCFVESRKATAVRLKQQPAAEEEILKTVYNTIRMVFREVGGDYDLPTRGALELVTGSLAHKAQGWGVPPEIIEHHRAQCEKILGKL